MYGTTARPDLAKKLGFQAAKFPLPYGPGDGDEGMRKNIECIKAVGVGVLQRGFGAVCQLWMPDLRRGCLPQQVRESVGNDFPIMIDCYMSLTAQYTIELARRVNECMPHTLLSCCA